MGSSVFHGGFSTFVSLSVLAPSRTYIFVAFYRLWFGIIIFGMANGFFLLPVILSFVGPTATGIDPSLYEDEGGKETDYDIQASSYREKSFSSEEESEQHSEDRPNISS